MLEKTFSQKTARVFEIAGYLLIIPATLWLIVSFMLVLMAISSFRLENILSQILILIGTLIPSFIYSLGILLLVGYFKHSRGTLNENRIISLWLGTFFYNLPPLLAVIYQIMIMPKDFHNIDFLQLFSPFMLISLALVIWWTIASILSAGAIYNELTEHKNYR